MRGSRTIGLLAVLLLTGLGFDAVRAQEPIADTAGAAPHPPAVSRDPASAAFFEMLRSIDSMPVLDSLDRAVADQVLRRAMVAERRHELSAELADAQAAFDLYYGAASSDTTSAWAFFGIGRVVADRPAVLFEKPGLLDELLPPRRIAGVLGLEPQSRAQQALLRALVLDPTIEEAALMIADMAVVAMDPMELEIAARALTFVTERADAAPEVWLALSRVRGLMADVDAANAAALTAMRGGADLSLSLVSAAAALLTQTVTEERGARAYLEGTRLLSDEGAARYFRDVEQILGMDAHRAWRGMGLEERGAWLRRYWDVRAGLAGISVARSLGEHYRRLAHAERMYGGEYGKPSPVEQLLGTGDFFPNTVRTGFTQPLDYVYDFYQFRGSQERTSITTALAVPVSQLRPMLTDSQVVYGLRVSMILVDTLNEAVSRKDTVLYFANPRLAAAESFLRAYLDVELAPSERIVYRVTARDAFDPRTGALFGGPIELRDFGATAIQMSDVVLTREDAGHWTRGDLTLPLTPAQSFATTEPITIFYEVYNLPPNTPYRTQIRVVPVVRGVVDRLVDLVNPGSRSQRVSFESTTPRGAGPVQEVRTLQMPLRPDAYEIQVTIIDLRSGERASASSQVTLVGVE
ncbi:MAG TPA: hypothetical protein VMN78_09460 [Longimicrobiales bacterium]|nr:hypothetical protein [Longimicrobiales bacterium]